MRMHVLILLFSSSLAFGGIHRRATVIPSCSFLDKLNDQHFQMLRDNAMMLSQAERKAVNYRLLDDMKSDLAKRPIGEQHAYNTSHTASELRDLAATSKKLRDTREEKLEALIADLKRNNEIPNDTTSMNVRTCVYGQLNAQMYEYRPKISLMMQYFKRPQAIAPFIEAMQACNSTIPIELVVNVDHPQDHEAWAKASYSSKGLVIPVFSNNIHEVRSYNRLASLARGEVLVMMADDDKPPSDCSWMSKLVSIFDKWPATGVVGIRNYNTCHDHSFLYQRPQPNFIESDAGNRGLWFKDPKLPGDIPLMFVEKVDMAPLAVRRSAYLHIGGMDETMTEPGECGILTDWDLSLRMWVAGWHVMSTQQVVMTHDGQPGGTHKPETQDRCWGKQSFITGSVLKTHMTPEFEMEICHVARTLTLKNLVQINASECPYSPKLGCKL